MAVPGQVTESWTSSLDTPLYTFSPQTHFWYSIPSPGASSDLSASQGTGSPSLQHFRRSSVDHSVFVVDPFPFAATGMEPETPPSERLPTYEEVVFDGQADPLHVTGIFGSSSILYGYSGGLHELGTPSMQPDQLAPTTIYCGGPETPLGLRCMLSLPETTPMLPSPAKRRRNSPTSQEETPRRRRLIDSPSQDSHSSVGPSASMTVPHEHQLTAASTDVAFLPPPDRSRTGSALSATRRLIQRIRRRSQSPSPQRPGPGPNPSFAPMNGLPGGLLLSVEEAGTPTVQSVPEQTSANVVQPTSVQGHGHGHDAHDGPSLYTLPPASLGHLSPIQGMFAMAAVPHSNSQPQTQTEMGGERQLWSPASFSSTSTTSRGRRLRKRKPSDGALHTSSSVTARAKPQGLWWSRRRAFSEVPSLPARQGIDSDTPVSLPQALSEPLSLVDGAGTDTTTADIHSPRCLSPEPMAVSADKTRRSPPLRLLSRVFSLRS